MSAGKKFHASDENPNFYHCIHNISLLGIQFRKIISIVYFVMFRISFYIKRGLSLRAIIEFSAIEVIRLIMQQVFSIFESVLSDGRAWHSSRQVGQTKEPGTPLVKQGQTHDAETLLLLKKSYSIKNCQSCVWCKTQKFMYRPV